MLLAWLPLAAASPLAECTQTWTAHDLAAVVGQADARSELLDKDGYLAARDTLLARLGCVTEPLGAQDVGAIHRVVAMAAFLEREEGRVAPALAGLLVAIPGYQMPLEEFPLGHPVRDQLALASILARESGERPLVALPSGWLEVDGHSATSLPTERAAVVQQRDGEGRVVETRYLWPGDDLGGWTGGAPPEPSSPRRVAFGLAVGPAFTMAGEPRNETLQAVAFDGWGGRLGIRADLFPQAGFGLVAEVGYHDMFGDAGVPVASEYTVSRNQLHLGYGAVGLALRSGRLSSSIGAAWHAGWAEVTGVTAASVGDAASARYQRVEGSLALPGANARLGYEVARRQRVDAVLEAQGTVATDGDRVYVLSGLGVVLRPRLGSPARGG